MLPTPTQASAPSKYSFSTARAPSLSRLLPLFSSFLKGQGKSCSLLEAKAGLPPRLCVRSWNAAPQGQGRVIIPHLLCSLGRWTLNLHPMQNTTAPGRLGGNAACLLQTRGRDPMGGTCFKLDLKGRLSPASHTHPLPPFTGQGACWQVRGRLSGWSTQRTHLGLVSPVSVLRWPRLGQSPSQCPSLPSWVPPASDFCCLS